MRYKIRRAWRHFKYWLLERFFGKVELRKLIDIDRLDFEDAVKLTQINEEKWLTKDEMTWFEEIQGREYGLQYDLARQMAGTIASHVEVSKIYDLDAEKYLCVGSITICERKN